MSKVFLILDNLVSSIVDAVDADRIIKDIKKVSFPKTKVEVVSKEEFISRGFFYCEEKPRVSSCGFEMEEEEF